MFLSDNVGDNLDALSNKLHCVERLVTSSTAHSAIIVFKQHATITSIIKAALIRVDPDSSKPTMIRAVCELMTGYFCILQEYVAVKAIYSPLLQELLV
jgi:hypothetical protein